MMIRRVVMAGAALLVSGLGLVFPAAGAAQELEQACDAVSDASIGAWSEHVVESPNGTFDMRFSLVTDRGATWYEIGTNTSAGRSILQLRVPGFPFAPSEIAEVVTKTGPGPAMRLPDSLVRRYAASAQSGPLSDIRGQCLAAELVGREEITVPAGTFVTTHLRFPNSGGDVWVSEEVPFGIVRGDVPNQGSTILQAHGSGATSSITETPLTFGVGGAGGTSAP